MNIDPQWLALFEVGFPIENPDLILPWGKSVEEVAQSSGGIRHGDRFSWQNMNYLQGLGYPLFSEMGAGSNHSFHEITAYIGLVPQDSTDAHSLESFNYVSNHLTAIFGDPTQRHLANDLGERDVSWQVGPIHFYLSIIEQHALQCFLTIRDPESLRLLHSN